MRMTGAAPWAAAAITCAASFGAVAQPGDVGPVTDSLYAKECGACHVAYSPGLLPERSWRRIMQSLGNHFNDDAQLKPAEREHIQAYLVANAGDHGASRRAREIVASIPPGETPVRISKTPYIEGIHGGLLDPIFKGRPAAKSLSECAICHQRAAEGRFGERRYIVTDEEFRRN